MRNIYLLSLVLITSGVLLLVQHSTASNYLKNDALERAYRDAAEIAAMSPVPEGRGCETIPFPFQRDCIKLREKKEDICRSGEKLRCNEFKNPLYHAKKNKDAQKITEIRDVCVRRRDNAQNCMQIRNTVQGIFNAAQERVETEKTRFERNLNNVKDKQTEDFFRRMIGYADTILAYYKSQSNNHEDEITRLMTPRDVCAALVDDADKALKDTGK